MNPPNIPDLMNWADIAISAGGSTCWELAFLELPSLLMILSRDQEGIVNGLSRNGFALKINDYAEQGINKVLRALIVDHEKRMMMSIQGRKLVDGGGSYRIIKAMEAHVFDLQRAAKSLPI